MSDKCPSGFFLQSLLNGTNRAVKISDDELRAAFLESDILPTDMPEDARMFLVARGVEFLGPIENDPTFELVRLPIGWKKVPSDHSMWSDLQDSSGKKVAKIFFNPTFYNRSAHLDLVR